MSNIAKRFYLAKDTYKKNSPAQTQMRYELIKLLESNIKDSKPYFKNVFEFGARAFEFTKMLIEKIEFESYICNDICDYGENIFSKKIKKIIFDMNELESSIIFNKKFDLIVSNACMQWLPFEKTLHNLTHIMNKNALLLLSSFGIKNLYEIKEITNAGLNYLNLEEMKNILNIYFKDSILQEKIYTLHFNNPLEVFRHLQKSGVNSCESSINYIKKSWLQEYEKRFNNTLTYHAIFITARF